MIEALKWFLFIEGVGWIFFPIAQTFFPNFKDKGYTAGKIVGLLVIGYFFWLGNSFQLIPNSRSGVYLTLFLIFTFFGFFFYKKGFSSIFQWAAENIRIIVFFDFLFLITFFGWALVRASYPEIIGTEKPMELAFINGIYKSPSFPPNDPWLSDYSISYYYFGYLLVSIFMHLLGTSSGTAFNLAVALCFSLTAVISAGLLFNIISANYNSGKEKTKSILLIILLAPLLILVVSNAEGLLEVMHSSAFFWKMDKSGVWFSKFWSWLDIQELVNPPNHPFDLVPSRAGGAWWWRASRVLQDYTAARNSREIIDEFPFFSYLLADFHPHVISMPFVLLVVYLGLDIFLNIPKIEWGLRNSFRFWFRGKGLWIGFISGSLILVNTWDFPICFALIVGLFMVSRARNKGWEKERIKEFFNLSIPYGILSIGLYLPFLIGLSSQAGGFLPSLVFKTRLIHFLVMFFPQVMVITPILFVLLVKNANLKEFMKNLLIVFAFTVLLFVISLLIPLAISSSPFLLERIRSLIGINFGFQIEMDNLALQSFLGIYESRTVGELIGTTLKRVIGSPFLFVFLVLTISISVTFLFSKKNPKDELKENGEQFLRINELDRFIFTLILLASLIILIPEIFYLRDQFGWRMNTIFKFYFQAWILFSISSGYFVFRIFEIRPGKIRLFLLAFAFLGLAAGLIYPIFGMLEKTNRFQNMVWSLDGNKYLEASSPEEFEAIEFLKNADYGVVSEAVGGSYSSYGRVSKLTGLPTVLGWPGHEVQWRGGGEEIGTRENDIRDLYTTNNWDRAREIIETYSIRYIYIGQLERSAYSVSDIKFKEKLSLIFDNDAVQIYEFGNNG